MSAEVNRRRVETCALIRSELCESNELSRYERVEGKKKHDSSLSVRMQLNGELKLELSSEVDRKISETRAHITSELSETNELSSNERVEAKQKNGLALAFIY